MGPLAGTRIIEMTGLGPGPFCGMLLADMGADVVAIDRPGSLPDPNDPHARGRSARLALDLKVPGDRDRLLDLVARSDALFEGFRPGVMERLGLGPVHCHDRNPRLVYGRMTGWGQSGPLAPTAGHDINYIAISGALAPIGRAGDRPVPPLNFVGDLGGGGMLLAYGMVCALLESRRSGRGDVVDAAVLDGAASMAGVEIKLRARGLSTPATGSNVLSGSAPWYDTYETMDGRFIAIGALEPQFLDLLCERIGVDRERFAQYGLYSKNGTARDAWPALKAELAAVFRARTRDEWCALLEGTDACFAPVLDVTEAPAHAHNAARGTFIEVGGIAQAAPAPRFARSVPTTPAPPASAHADIDDVVARWTAPAA